MKALAAAFHTVNGRYLDAMRALGNLQPGRPVGLPALKANHWILVALQREGLDPSQDEGELRVDGNFDLLVPMQRFADQLAWTLNSMRLPMPDAEPAESAETTDAAVADVIEEPAVA